MGPMQINRLSVADQAATILRQRIIGGELRPGEHLPEASLASSLGVSRNTMREAMRILSIEGLLRHSLYKGVSVFELSLRDVKEIYQLRRMLEISGVRAARKSHHAILGELQRTLGEHEAAVRLSRSMKAVSFDLEFHILLTLFHQNRRLEFFYRNMIGKLRVGTVLVDRSHDDPRHSDSRPPQNLSLITRLEPEAVRRGSFLALGRFRRHLAGGLGKQSAARAVG